METHGRLHFIAIREGARPLPVKMGSLLLREEENKKPAGNERFNPDKYGMVVCRECKGSGKSSNGLKVMGVCRACGGFGLTKKQ